MERPSKQKEENGDTDKEEEMFYSPDSMEEKNEEFQSNNDEENKKIDELRDMVAKQDPACKEVDEVALRRFLRARDLDIEKASKMVMKYLTWRRKFVPMGSISASETPNHIAHNKVFLQGRDRRGCPVAVVFGAKHFPCKGINDEFKRFTVFALDKICSRIPYGEEKFTIIVDLEGFGYSNSDVRGYIAALSILQDYYPERLKKLFFVHVSYIFMAAWKIVFPFVDKNTRKKVTFSTSHHLSLESCFFYIKKFISDFSSMQITFVENKKLHSALIEEIDVDQLPQIYGGKLQLVPIQDA